MLIGPLDFAGNSHHLGKLLLPTANLLNDLKSYQF